MSDKPSIQERYMVARTTSNLAVEFDTTMSASDILAAAGMAGQAHGLAIQLWQLEHSPNRHLLAVIESKLKRWLEDHMALHKMKGNPRRITRAVLTWHLDGLCRTCNGLGYERIHGTPHLSDVMCPDCFGTGTKKLQTENDQAAHWVYEQIKSLTSSASKAIHRKIK